MYIEYIERPLWILSHIKYIGGALSNNGALDSACTELCSHVPCVHRETPLDNSPAYPS